MGFLARLVRSNIVMGTAAFVLVDNIEPVERIVDFVVVVEVAYIPLLVPLFQRLREVENLVVAEKLVDRFPVLYKPVFAAAELVVVVDKLVLVVDIVVVGVLVVGMQIFAAAVAGRLVVVVAVDR
jgi:hypothetical protein